MLDVVAVSSPGISIPVESVCQKGILTPHLIVTPTQTSLDLQNLRVKTKFKRTFTAKPHHLTYSSVSKVLLFCFSSACITRFVLVVGVFNGLKLAKMKK